MVIVSVLKGCLDLIEETTNVTEPN